MVEARATGWLVPTTCDLFPFYGAAKSVADCFKYRNKLGLDVALEALKLYLSVKHGRPDELLRFARACRVEKVIAEKFHTMALRGLLNSRIGFVAAPRGESPGLGESLLAKMEVSGLPAGDTIPLPLEDHGQILPVVG